jgi:hypothetical protein
MPKHVLKAQGEWALAVASAIEQLAVALDVELWPDIVFELNDAGDPTRPWDRISPEHVEQILTDTDTVITALIARGLLTGSESAAIGTAIDDARGAYRELLQHGRAVTTQANPRAPHQPR